MCSLVQGKAMKQYKATYRSGAGNGVTHTTRYYDSSSRAQAQLQDRIGHFHYLGAVAGDVCENGECTVAARQGGTVAVDEREV